MGRYRITLDVKDSLTADDAEQLARALGIHASGVILNMLRRDAELAVRVQRIADSQPDEGDDLALLG